MLSELPPLERSVSFPCLSRVTKEESFNLLSRSMSLHSCDRFLPNLYLFKSALLESSLQSSISQIIERVSLDPGGGPITNQPRVAYNPQPYQHLPSNFRSNSNVQKGKDNHACCCICIIEDEEDREISHLYEGFDLSECCNPVLDCCAQSLGLIPSCLEGFFQCLCFVLSSLGDDD